MTPVNPLSEKGSRYFFERVEYCEMCDDPVAGHKVLGLRLNQSWGCIPEKNGDCGASSKVYESGPDFFK